MKTNLQNTKYQIQNPQTGITLVALIITVIVLLILAMVSIRLVMNGGIIDRAEKGTQAYSESEIQEQIKLAYSEWQSAKWDGTAGDVETFISERLQKSFNLQANEIEVEVESGTVTVTIGEKEYTYDSKMGSITVDKPLEKIKKSTAKVDNYVGYYADIDKDGNVDGVIFVDLLTGSKRDTQSWCRNTGAYTLPTDVLASNVKNYYISKESYTWAGITKPVLSPIGNGKERFYVMQLIDFTTLAKTDGTEENYPEYQLYSFYKNANMTPLVTTNNFGDGKENTRKMIEKWNATGTSNGYTDSLKDKQDIWKHIQTKYAQGWFIPSRAEWSAFANELEITGNSNGNYNSKYGLNDCYWSSSQSSNKHAWHARFKDYTMYEGVAENTYAIRLARIF